MLISALLSCSQLKSFLCVPLDILSKIKLIEKLTDYVFVLFDMAPLLSLRQQDPSHLTDVLTRERRMHLWRWCSWRWSGSRPWPTTTRRGRRPTATWTRDRASGGPADRNSSWRSPPAVDDGLSTSFRCSRHSHPGMCSTTTPSRPRPRPRPMPFEVSRASRVRITVSVRVRVRFWGYG